MWDEDLLMDQLKKRREQQARKRILPNPLPIYGADCEIPEAMRVSFSDGSTEIYDLRRNGPAQVIVENIKIIRKWKQEYVNQPARRRNKK